MSQPARLPERDAPDRDMLEAARRHEREGRIPEALACHRWALAAAPDDPALMLGLGVALAGARRLDEAETWLRRAIARRPDVADAHIGLGDTLRAWGRLDEAIASYRRALDLRPADAAARTGLGVARQARREQDAAIAGPRREAERRPDHAGAQFDLGFALGRQGRLAEAADCYRRALALKPDDLAALNNLGNALKALGALEEAAACYRRALALRPDIASLHYNLGNTLKAQAMQWSVDAARSGPDETLLDDAVAAYRAALARQPEYREAHLALAMLLMRRGDIPQGWAEYEWRWMTPRGALGRHAQAHRAGAAQAHRAGAAQAHQAGADGTDKPQWRGEPAGAENGRILLIQIDGGFGDTLHFCRYAPLAAARGWRVILEVQPGLARLLRGLEGVDRIMTGDEATPAFDVHCPMLTLPLALGSTLETIPARVPYLRAAPDAVAAWGARLAAIESRMPPGFKKRPRIGIAWAGAFYLDAPAKVMNAQLRALAPDLLAPILALPAPHFVSLQKGGPPAPANVALTDLTAELADFADTAALMANLDLIVTVDTSVAHLAGALGRPVWMMTRHDQCWRWLDGRTDSPWYPTMRIHRQTRPGDWEGVVAEIAAALAADLACGKIG
jgi:tetratricopeptide (TPR) repeat protein